MIVEKLAPLKPGPSEGEPVFVQALGHPGRNRGSRGNI